jgi:DNA-binding response OmpR family regulator
MKRKILVADDEENIVNLVKLSLSPQFEVVSAKDGHEAVKVFEKERPVLVLLDLMMPGMDGYEVCKEIKKISKNVPVVVLSAKDHRTDILKGMGSGADDYVTKPFEPNELLLRVEMNLLR